MQFTAALTLLALFVTTEAAKPRSINVALDTVLEFDQSSDVEVINHVQGVLDKVKHIIKDNRRRDGKEPVRPIKRYTFNEFLQDVLAVLLAFNDDDLEEIMQIVDSEIKKSTPNNTIGENIRRFLTNELDRVKIKPIREVRQRLDTFLRKMQNGKKDKDNYFLGFINMLYKRNSEEKLAKFIRKLNIFRRSDKKSRNLQNTVREAVDIIIFSPISNLAEVIKDKAHSTMNIYGGNDDEIYSRVGSNTQPKSESNLQQNDEPKALVIERNFKSSHEKISELFLETSEETESSKENIEILDDGRLTTSTYTIDNKPKITQRKANRRHNHNIMKRKTKTSGIIRYSKNSLKHITLYPENLDIAIGNYRDIVIVGNSVPKHHSKIKNYVINKNEKTSDDDVTSRNSAETDVNFKNKKTTLVFKDNKSATKVRALRQKVLKRRTTKNTEDSTGHDLADLNIMINEFSMPKTVQYFGNVFENKRYKKVNRSYSKRFHSRSQRSRITDYLKQTENKTGNDIDKIENFTKKRYMIIRKNFGSKRKIVKATTSNDFRGKHYSLANELSIAEDKNDAKLKAIKITGNHDRISNELNFAKNNPYKTRRTSGIKDDNNDRLASEHKFVENKPYSKNKKLQTIELTHYNDDRLADEPRSLENKPYKWNKQHQKSELTHENDDRLADELKSVENQPLRKNKKHQTTDFTHDSDDRLADEYSSLENKSLKDNKKLLTTQLTQKNGERLEGENKFMKNKPNRNNKKHQTTDLTNNYNDRLTDEYSIEENRLHRKNYKLQKTKLINDNVDRLVDEHIIVKNKLFRNDKKLTTTELRHEDIHSTEENSPKPPKKYKTSKNIPHGKDKKHQPIKLSHDNNYRLPDAHSIEENRLSRKNKKLKTTKLTNENYDRLVEEHIIVENKRFKNNKKLTTTELRHEDKHSTEENNPELPKKHKTSKNIPHGKDKKHQTIKLSHYNNYRLPDAQSIEENSLRRKNKKLQTTKLTNDNDDRLVEEHIIVENKLFRNDKLTTIELRLEDKNSIEENNPELSNEHKTFKTIPHGQTKKHQTIKLSHDNIYRVTDAHSIAKNKAHKRNESLNSIKLTRDYNNRLTDNHSIEDNNSLGKNKKLQTTELILDKNERLVDKHSNLENKPHRKNKKLQMTKLIDDNNDRLADEHNFIDYKQHREYKKLRTSELAHDNINGLADEHSIEENKPLIKNEKHQTTKLRHDNKNRLASEHKFAENKPHRQNKKLQTVELTHDNNKRLADQQKNGEDKAHKETEKLQTTKSAYDNNDRVTHKSNTVEKKPNKSLRNLPISSKKYPYYNRGYRRAKEPMIKEMREHTNDMNETSMLNTVNALNITSNLGLTTKIIPPSSHEMESPATPDTKAETKTFKVTKKVKEFSSLNKINSDINLQRDNKISDNKSRNTPTYYTKRLHIQSTPNAITEKLILRQVTKSDDLNEISNIVTNPRRGRMINRDTKQSEIKSNLRQEVKTNELNYVTRKLYINAIVTTNNTKTINNIMQPNITPNTTAIINEEKKIKDIKSETTPIAESNTTYADLFPDDIKEYIKNPKVVDVEDVEKKNKIEQQMKADLDNFFTEPVTNATTTAAYTDIFDDLDDAFGID